MPHSIPSAGPKGDGNLHSGSRRGKQLDGEADRSALRIDIRIGRKTDPGSYDKRAVRLGPGETGENQTQYKCQSQGPRLKPQPERPHQARFDTVRREHPRFKLSVPPVKSFRRHDIRPGRSL
ncbi:protein of unknown function [Methylocaldum szegediense]|uniref:Uncharacterized protein n=1 Tax=Methylocaldum szegediense TaxID=73780 RepID=A0ABN8X8Z9_9GAMM|nr:protein of unknown function [Methylocaldum szegediense]